MNQARVIEQAEQTLLRALKAYQNSAINLVDTEADRQRYHAQLLAVPWENFVHKADYSYFVARTLLTQHVYLYGLFCAHQCVESYLKAFLKKIQLSRRRRTLTRPSPAGCASLRPPLMSNVGNVPCG